MFTIESGIAIPKTVRAAKGDSRMNAIKEGLDSLQKKGQSFLMPMDNLEQATEERKHYVFRANRYGKIVKKEFLIAAVDGEKGKDGKEGHPAGLRVWLVAEPPAAEVGGATEAKPEGEGKAEGEVEVPEAKEQAAAENAK